MCMWMYVFVCVCMSVTKILTEFSLRWLERFDPDLLHSTQFRVPYNSIELLEVLISSSLLLQASPSHM